MADGCCSVFPINHGNLFQKIWITFITIIMISVVSTPLLGFFGTLFHCNMSKNFCHTDQGALFLLQWVLLTTVNQDVFNQVILFIHLANGMFIIINKKSAWSANHEEDRRQAIKWLTSLWLTYFTWFWRSYVSPRHQRCSMPSVDTDFQNSA